MKEQAEKETGVENQTQPRRRRLPATRKALVHKFRVGQTKGFLRAGMYPDDTLGEVFLTVDRAGSTLQGLMDSFATSLSISLQYGIPLSVITTKFRHVRFEPNGFTGDKTIPTASSLIDYMAQWLEQRFLKGETKAA